ncbi:hypothetical protein MHYP_G00311810 [Metynnis hypsauchen]
MDKLWVILTLTGLLTSGAESFKISEKEYENIDRMLGFGVQIFLNCLDKVKEATEKLVKEDMLRTNRIAIQDNWNSFRETANSISVEERGKGVQDDLIVAARVVNMFKGTIERAKAKEIWGNLVSNYLPDAPSIESEPLEFLCYLLSTRARIIVKEVGEKLDEIRRIEREKEKDDFLLLVRLHFDFAREFYEIGISPLIALYKADSRRFERTLRVVGMSTVIHAYTVYEQLSDRGLFSEMKRLYFRAVDIGTALAGNEEVQYFRETYFEKWKSFREELNKFVDEERRTPHILLPQVRAVARMLIAKFEELVNKVNADVDDDTVQQMSTKWTIIKEKCIKKLLTSGALTQDQLDETHSIVLKDIKEFYDKYLEFTNTMDPQKAENASKAVVKVVVVGFNFIYAPLAQATDFFLA